MKTSSILLIITLAFICSCNSSPQKATAEKEAYEQAKESMEEREKNDPVYFLSVTGKDKRNLVGQTVIKGTISNKAKVCTYKDVQLELAFYSKTGTLLEKDKEIIFESIAPGKSVNFKTKFFAAKGTDSVTIKILAAKFEE